MRPFYENFESSQDGSSVSHLGDVFLPGFPPTHLILLITALLPKASGNLTSHYLLPPNHHSLHPHPGFTVAVNILFHNYGSIFPAGFLTFDAPGLFLTHLHFLVSVPHPPGRDEPLYTACLSALARPPSKLLHLLRQEGHPPPPLAAKHTSGIIMNSPPALTWSWDCKEEQILPNWNPITISALLTKRHTQLQTCSIFLLITFFF